jgi:hypothetical protein
VRKKNIPNMPATSSSLARKDPDLLRSANSRSGVMGWRARVSVSRNSASSAAATANAPSASPSPQPLAAALMNP